MKAPKIVPGHPAHGPFYIVQGLINAIPRFAWQVRTIPIYPKNCIALSSYKELSISLLLNFSRIVADSS